MDPMAEFYEMGERAYEAGHLMLPPSNLWPSAQLAWVDGWSAARKEHEAEARSEWWERRCVELEWKLAMGQ